MANTDRRTHTLNLAPNRNLPAIKSKITKPNVA